jgi:hypothetical protein
MTTTIEKLTGRPLYALDLSKVLDPDPCHQGFCELTDITSNTTESGWAECYVRIYLWRCFFQFILLHHGMVGRPQRLRYPPDASMEASSDTRYGKGITNVA